MANIDLNSVVNTSAVSGDGTLGMTTYLDSAINASVVGDPSLTVLTSVSSVVNSSVVSGFTSTMGMYADSVANSSIIGSLTAAIKITVASVTNTSTISQISRLPDAIGLDSVINTSVVSGVIIPTLVNLVPDSVNNTSVVSTAMIGGDTIIDEIIVPVTRPKKTVSKSTTGMRRWTFKDLAIKGGSHPLTGDLLTVTDFSAVAQSIRNIVMTNPTERFFDHIGFGVGIEQYLFQAYDSGLQGRIYNSIVAQIATYEPRAIIKDVIVDGKTSRHQLSIQIIFSIKTSNVTDSVTILLERR